MEAFYKNEDLVNSLLNNDCPKDIIDGVHHFQIDLHCVTLKIRAIRGDERWEIKHISIVPLSE